MKRTVFVSVLILVVASLASGCWHHHRRTSVTASDVLRPNTGAAAVGAAQR